MCVFLRIYRQSKNIQNAFYGDDVCLDGKI